MAAFKGEKLPLKLFWNPATELPDTILDKSMFSLSRQMSLVLVVPCGQRFCASPSAGIKVRHKKLTNSRRLNMATPLPGGRVGLAMTPRMTCGPHSLQKLRGYS